MATDLWSAEAAKWYALRLFQALHLNGSSVRGVNRSVLLRVLAVSQEGGRAAELGKLGGTPWWRQRDVGLCLLGYALIAFIFNLSNEVRPCARLASKCTAACSRDKQLS